MSFRSRSIPGWVLALLLGLVALTSHPALRAQQSTPAVPTFRAGTEAVALDVVVLNEKGEPVEDLSQHEFEVFEDGNRRPITTFSVVKVSDRSQEPSLGNVQTDVAVNTAPEGRLFVIALDEIETGFAGVDLVLGTRRMLREFVHALGPNDLAAVVLVGRGSVQTGQDFTSHKGRLIASIDRYGGGFSGDITNSLPLMTRLSYDSYRSINQFASLRDLVEFLATLPAKRKALVYVSEGFGRPGVIDVLDTMSRAETLREFCVERLQGVGPQIGSCRPSQELHRTLVAAARANVAVYPIDPKGNVGGGRDSEFVRLAAVTGGLAVTNTNPRPLLTQIVRENGSYYRIGVEAGHTRRNGQTVPIRVNTLRPGTRVLARSGYVSGFPDEKVIEATDTSTLNGALASPLPTAGIGLRVAAPVFKGSGTQGTIAIILEADARDLLAAGSGGAAGTGEVEVSYLATDVHRKVHKGKTFRVRLAAGPDAGPATSTVRFIMPMTLAKGRYQLRLASESQGRTGGVVQDIEIPDFDAPLIMSSVMLGSASDDKVPTFWPAGRTASGPLSRLATTRRVFTRDETLTISGELYLRAAKGRNGPVPLSAVLRDASSEKARVTHVLDATGLQKSPAFSVELPLTAVAPGAYVLRVAAGGDDLPNVVQELPIEVK